MRNRVTHLTVGYPRNEMMDLLRRSSEYHGFEYVELPQGWSGRLQVLDKLRIVGGYISSGAVRKDQVILFTDGYDTLVTGSAAALAHDLRASDHDLIFNGEIVFFPEDQPRPEARAFFDRRTERCRYLNSGCYVGYAWAVEMMTQWCLANAARIGSEDDQLLAQEFMIHAHASGLRVHVALDTRAELFATLVGSADRFGYLAGAVVNLETGAPVAVIHANGFKDNLLTLHAVDQLSLEGPALDLRVLRAADGRLAAHVPEGRRLHLAGGHDPQTVLFLVKGNRTVVALVPGRQVLTFCTDCTLTDDARTIQAWERLHYRHLTSDQGNPVSRYFETEAGEVSLAPVPLELMKAPGMPQLLAQARAVARQF